MEEEVLRGLRYDPVGLAKDPAFGVQGGERWSVVNVVRDYDSAVLGAEGICCWG